jgi:nucleotide-binding universal stress UspA family protein
MSDRPILIAYDGSPDAKAAIVRAGELFVHAPALVVSVWQAAETLVTTSAGAATYAPIFGEIDEIGRNNANASAEEGAALARKAGFDASSLAVRSDHRHAWRPIVDLADQRDARAIVIGSHGESGRIVDVLLGSTSSRVVEHADRPVLVVGTKPSS